MALFKGIIDYWALGLAFVTLNCTKNVALSRGPEQVIGSTPQESSYLQLSKSALLGGMFPENEAGKCQRPFVGALYFPSCHCQKIDARPIFSVYNVQQTISSRVVNDQVSHS